MEAKQNALTWIAGDHAISAAEVRIITHLRFLSSLGKEKDIFQSSDNDEKKGKEREEKLEKLSQTLTALFELASKESTLNMLGSWGAVDILFDFTSKADVAFFGQPTSVLQNLSTLETFREEMASDEHIQQLLTLLKKAKDDEVRDNICSVLVNLALDEETGEKIGKSHGIKELLSILSVSNSKEVQKSACTALWNLSSVDSNKDQFDSLAIEQLLTILKQASEKKNNEELQADLCGLFQNLALKGLEIFLLTF
eukprot:TRINITY_DN3943_c0_g2_i1.p1 TRINITY_DN3943_c0_g2~~TRINITY_DN3943_c0_g2_i1.p1  ORF type:complete len:285 (-),score=76.17 TRINITY_DN3943_c0_g2_i1:537-1298(-)